MFGTASLSRLRHDNEMRNKWLKTRLDELGKTQSGLAREMKLVRSRIGEIIRGDRRIAGHEVATIARYLEWPEAKVLGFISDPSGFAPNVEPSDRPVVAIQVVGEVAAGVFKDALELPHDERYAVHVPTSSAYAHLPLQGLLVRGPSMDLLYPERTVLVVVPVVHLGEGFMPRNGQRVIVQRTNAIGEHEATVKEIIFDAAGTPWLWPRSTHPEFQQPWRLPQPEEGNGNLDHDEEVIRITGLVIGSYRPE